MESRNVFFQANMKSVLTTNVLLRSWVPVNDIKVSKPLISCRDRFLLDPSVI